MKISDLVKKSLDWIIRLNLLGMLVGGLWLLYYNNLGAAWPGVLGLVVSTIIFPVLLIPAAFFAGLMTVVGKTKPFAEKLLELLSVLYIVSIMSGYETIIFYQLSGAQPKGAAMLYAVAAGVAPWAIHARQDRNNVFYTGLIIMMQVAAIVLDAANEIFRLKDFTAKYFIIWGTMLLLVGLQMLFDKIFIEKKRKELIAQAMSGNTAETK